ncbi:MAG: HAD-IA family hydrolase [Acidobacteria bacterium]|nr:HAD-IA family hydrolase [Acidobacteriota bacterium]
MGSGDLERTGLNRFFRASRSADDAAGKPNPEMLFGLLEELGVCAEDALMVGDAVHDLEMANNAGVAAVGVASVDSLVRVYLRPRRLASAPGR